MKKFKIMPKIPAMAINISFIFFLFTSGCTNSTDTLNHQNMPMQKETRSPESEENVTIEGKVLEIKSNNELLIDTLDHNKIVLHITENTSIWDGITWIAEIPTQKDDHIIAYGVWEPDRTNFSIHKMYVNIENLQGIVDTIDKENSKFVMKDSREGKIIVAIDALTEISGSESGKTYIYQNIQTFPKSGDYVEVIGRKITGGAVIAVKLFMQ